MKKILLCFIMVVVMLCPILVFAEDEVVANQQQSTTEDTKKEEVKTEKETPVEKPQTENKKEDTTQNKNTEKKPTTTKTQNNKSTNKQETASDKNETKNSSSKEDTSSYKPEINYYNPEIGTTLRYPLSRKATISTYFNEHDYLHPSGHTGVDFAIAGGTPILASESGIITRASWYGGYGNCVDIEHKNGLMTRYAHMSEINVQVGDKVIRGQQIGRVGSTGRSTGNHLHFEAIYEGKLLNPLQYLEEVAIDEEAVFSNVKFLFVNKESTKDNYNEGIYFQLNERCEPVIKNGKTYIDVSEYYNNGLINEEPLLLNSDYKTSFKDKTIIIDKEITQSEIQLVIPSNDIQNNSVVTNLYKNGINFDTFMSNFSPLFDMKLNIEGDNIDKSNLTIRINNEELSPEYYTYSKNTLTIRYSSLYVTSLDIDILDELKEIEDKELVDSINNITTWIQADGIDLISLNSTIDCYISNSILPDIDTSYNLIPYNRYNFEYEDEEVKNNILVDNQLANAFISIPTELLADDMKLSSNVDSQTYYEEKPENQTFTYENKEYNVFIYGENILLSENENKLESGIYPVNFKILDYNQEGKYTYFIISYNVEGIGGYFGLQVKN